jgi:hypothetical protein
MTYTYLHVWHKLRNPAAVQVQSKPYNHYATASWLVVIVSVVLASHMTYQEPNSCSLRGPSAHFKEGKGHIPAFSLQQSQKSDTKCEDVHCHVREWPPSSLSITTTCTLSFLEHLNLWGHTHGFYFELGSEHLLASQKTVSIILPAEDNVLAFPYGDVVWCQSIICHLDPGNGAMRSHQQS